MTYDGFHLKIITVLEVAVDIHKQTFFVLFCFVFVFAFVFF